MFFYRSNGDESEGMMNALLMKHLIHLCGKQINISIKGFNGSTKDSTFAITLSTSVYFLYIYKIADY